MNGPGQRRTADPIDGLGALGFLMLVAGCLLVSVPLGLVVGGVVLLGVALAGAVRKGR